MISLRKANFYKKSEYINVSAGVADAAKPIILGAAGKISTTMLGGAPQFDRMGIGVAPHATIPLMVQSADNVDAIAVKIDAATASITAADTFISFQSNQAEIGDVSGTIVGGAVGYNP